MMGFPSKKEDKYGEVRLGVRTWKQGGDCCVHEKVNTSSGKTFLLHIACLFPSYFRLPFRYRFLHREQVYIHLGSSLKPESNPFSKVLASHKCPIHFTLAGLLLHIACLFTLNWFTPARFCLPRSE
jgi:hypothetical protein